MRLTEELIRRKAEHHDGLLADLEELSLHQLEIERIEGLGALRKLRILYLQNNVIARMEGLGHAKDLRYLNLALNNVLTIEGLAVCEFLNKLDLTVNFISVGALELSVDHLSPLLHLRELYLMGNPCSEWGGYREFVVASLPQLASLDGKDITRSERLAAQQRYRALQTGLREMAAAKLAEQGSAASDVITAGTESAAAADDNDDESSPWNPATRLKAYRKVAAQKQAEEERKRGLQPEARNADAEQAAAVAGARSSESAAGHQRVRQVNEGRWDFRLEDSDSGYSLRLGLSKYLDSSLVDVDVHPAYVSVVIKAKTFRLLWPEEVRSSDAVCQRSHATGELVITAPAVARRRGLGNSSTGLDSLSGSTAARGGGTKGRGAVTTTTAGGTGNRPRKLADELLELTGAVDVSCIVPQPQRQPASAPVQRSAEADGSGKSTLIGELLGDAGGGAPVGSTDNVKASILFPPPSAPPVPVPVAESPIATFPGTYDAFNAQHGASDDLPDLEDLQL